jgi:DNA-binding NarL/FixJ family response regulator
MRGKGPITNKERQVLDMLAEYRPYKYIAASMNISIITVYNHVASIMLKTGIHDQASLIKYAVDHRYGKQEVSA